MTKQQKERNYWVLPGVMTMRKLTKDDIINTVCDRLQLQRSEVTSKCRRRELVEARQICMYIIKKRINCTLAEIGMPFGIKHDTALYSIRMVSSFIEMNYQAGLLANELTKSI